MATSDSGHELHAEQSQHILITGEDGQSKYIPLSSANKCTYTGNASLIPSYNVIPTFSARYLILITGEDGQNKYTDLFCQQMYLHRQ